MSDLHFRRATEADIPVIVAMLADDALGKSREDLSEPLAEGYRSAFATIDRDPHQLLAVMEEDGRIVGTLQISFLAGLSRKGATRGQIEAVRVAADRRGARRGEKLIEWAIGQCRERGCGIVQLTTDKSRTDAHRFYDRLGFTPSHIGYKLDL